MRKKLTRSESLVIAQEARKLPEGIKSIRVHIQLPITEASVLSCQNSAERGSTYSLGLSVSQDGYLLLYNIIYALGGRIFTTIVGSTITIVTRKKSYEGQNQSDLLLQIIQDLIQGGSDEDCKA